MKNIFDQWISALFAHSKPIYSLIFQTMIENKINITAKKTYEGPYFHEESSSFIFAQIIAETYESTRSKFNWFTALLI